MLRVNGVITDRMYGPQHNFKFSPIIFMYDCVCNFCVCSCYLKLGGGHCRPYKSRSHFTPPVLGQSSAYMKYPLPTSKFSGGSALMYFLTHPLS